jgi:integrase
MGSRGRRLTDEGYRRFWWSVVTRGVACVNVGALTPRGCLSARERAAWRGLVLLTLLGEAGLRVGEACKLAWRDLGGVRGGGDVFKLPAEICKGGRPRDVVLSPLVRLVLLRWWDVVGEVFGEGDGVAVLTTNMTGRTLGVRGAQYQLVKMGRAHLGVPVWPHDLRRTYGDRCRRFGDVRLAQLQLGHARLSSTERYLADRIDERRELGCRLTSDMLPAGSELAACVERFRGVPLRV